MDNINHTILVKISIGVFLKWNRIVYENKEKVILEKHITFFIKRIDNKLA